MLAHDTRQHLRRAARVAHSPLTTMAPSPRGRPRSRQPPCPPTCSRVAARMCIAGSASSKMIWYVPLFPFLLTPPTAQAAPAAWHSSIEVAVPLACSRESCATNDERREPAPGAVAWVAIGDSCGRSGGFFCVPCVRAATRAEAGTPCCSTGSLSRSWSACLPARPACRNQWPPTLSLWRVGTLHMPCIGR